MTILDAANSNPLQGGHSFSLRHRLFRAAWNAVWMIFAAWTPVPFHSWRVMILRLFGASIADNAKVYPSCKVWYPPNLHMESYSVLGPNTDCYCIEKIRIGQYAIISQYAHLCSGSHDLESPWMQLIAKPITIGQYSWIAAGAFVGPGVCVEEGAVLGARAVVTGRKDLEAWTIYVGNPATALKKRRKLY